MATLFSFFASIYATFQQFKYFKDCWQASVRASQCGYDRESRIQRSNEAMGMGLAADSIREEFFIKRTRDLSLWEASRIVQAQLLARAALLRAGWGQDRIERLVSSLLDRFETESAEATEGA